MKLLTGICCLLLMGAGAKAQEAADDAVQVYVVDSVEVGSSAVNNIGPDQIAMITIARGRKTIEKFGERAANGVFYLETKPFARKRYNRLFSNLSPAYAATLQKLGSDSGFRYIIGDSVITTNLESQLAALEPKDIAAVQVLTDPVLIKQYGIKEREVGVIVEMK